MPLRGESHPTCYRPIRGGSPTGPPPGPARRSVWTMSIDWNEELAEQLDWHWRSHLRPRFDGLTDEEYFWEPVPGMWSVRPRGTSTTPVAVGGGESVQRVLGLVSQVVGPHREHVVRDDIVVRSLGRETPIREVYASTVMDSHRTPATQAMLCASVRQKRAISKM